MSDWFKYNYQEEALSLLLPQFQGKEGVEGLVDALLEPSKDFQSGVEGIVKGYNLETASDAQLDKIGKLLNVSRLERSNDDYRNAIKARIIINSADGSCDNFLEMLDLVLPEGVTYKVFEQFPAAIRVFIYGEQDVITKEVIEDISPIGVESVYFNNPYTGKEPWIPQDLSTTGNNTNAILPDVADIATSNIVIMDIIYTS